MSKFVVAIFCDEGAANNAVRKLKGLKDETLFDTLAVLSRSADGKLSVRDNVYKASAAAAGALIGAVAGFPAGGPAAAALGTNGRSAVRALGRSA